MRQLLTEAGRMSEEQSFPFSTLPALEPVVTRRCDIIFEAFNLHLG